MTFAHTSNPAPGELQRLLEVELSMRSRIGHVALFLAAALMTAVVASLWVTEPALPVRTTAAFALMTLIGLSWMAFSGWVLASRRPLFGRDRLVAGRMAVAFTATFTGGSLAVGSVSGGTAPYAAAGMGLVLLASAVALLVRARRDVARLTMRREALERELGLAQPSARPTRQDD
jgi:hypothetical protein